MSGNIELPKDKNLAAQVITAQSKERGMIGHVFGTKDHAPMNIAALAVVLMMVLLGIVLFASLPADVPRSALITSLLSSITFTLGLIFGRTSGGQ